MSGSDRDCKQKDNLDSMSHMIERNDRRMESDSSLFSNQRGQRGLSLAREEVSAYFHTKFLKTARDP